MADQTIETLSEKLDQLISAVSRLAPARAPAPDFAAADCFVWAADPGFLEPVAHVNRVDIGLIRGVDRVRDILVENTERFAAGYAANNVLLWGARGMGKSSLVKAVHAEINAKAKSDLPLKLIEIHREDIDTLRHEALEWATTRGSRSGRVAFQFTQELAGRLGQKLRD